MDIRGIPGAPLADVAQAHSKYLKPTGAAYETFDRQTAYSQTTAILSTGRLSMVAIGLPAGFTVTNIAFVSASQALAVGSNQWFALFDSSRGKLGVTSDDTSTAWGTFAVKSLALASPYVVPTAGLYYLGICVVANTVPSLTTTGNGANTLASLAPILTGTADSSLTNPASCPSTASAISATVSAPYAYVS